MMLKKEETDKIAALKEKLKVTDLKPEDAQIIVLQSIADSLTIIAHKLGRKLL